MLDLLVQSLNNREHRMIRMEPAEAEKAKNHVAVREAMEIYIQVSAYAI